MNAGTLELAHSTCLFAVRRRRSDAERQRGRRPRWRGDLGRGGGLADAEATIEAAPDTEYRIGSITKNLHGRGDHEQLCVATRHCRSTVSAITSPERLRRRRQPPALLDPHVRPGSRDPVEVGDARPPRGEGTAERLAAAEQILGRAGTGTTRTWCSHSLGEVVACARAVVPGALCRRTAARSRSGCAGRPGSEPSLGEGVTFVEADEMFLRRDADHLELRPAPRSVTLEHNRRPVPLAAFLAAPIRWCSPRRRWKIGGIRRSATTERLDRGYGLGLSLHRVRGSASRRADGGSNAAATLPAWSSLPRGAYGAAALTNTTAGPDPGQLASRSPSRRSAWRPAPEEPWGSREKPAPPPLADLLGRWWGLGFE